MEKEYIKNWSEKLLISEEEITKEFNKVLNEEKELHPELNESNLKTKALQRLALQYKKQLRSPAVGFEGIIFAVSDSIDYVAKRRREAILLHAENPIEAINRGITDENGVPLDTKMTWADGRANPGYNKPLPLENINRTICGVCLKSGKDDTPKYFILSISGDLAKKENIPMFKPVRFRALDRTKIEDTDIYSLNGSIVTNFVVDDSIKLPPIQELIKSYCSNMVVEIPKLLQYHIDNEENYNRLAIVTGDVSMISLTPTSVGSRRLVLEEVDNLDIESKGITCWVPGRVNIDFAEGSKVIVIGRTGRGKKRDEATGEMTQEPGDVMMNVYGLFAIPEYKIAPIKMMDVDENTFKDKSEDSW